MTDELDLPPVYEAVTLDAGGEDPRAHARRLAAAGGEAGLFVWRPSAARLDCAVVLRPQDAADGLLPVALVAAVAMLDALGRAGPAAVAADLVWPATIRINGGAVGGIALDLGPGEAPEWMVVSAALRRAGIPDIEAGERPDLTSLAEEGFGAVSDRAILEAFARYFLVWMDRWEEGGFSAVAPHWLQRARSAGGDTVIEYGGELVAGGIEGLDDSGALLLDAAQRPRLALEAQLLAPDPAKNR